MEKLGEFPGFAFDPNSPWQGVRDLGQSAASYGTAGTLASMMERGGTFKGNIIRGGVVSAGQGLAIDIISNRLGTDTSPTINLVGAGVGMAATPYSIRISQKLVRVPVLRPNMSQVKPGWAGLALAIPTVAEAGVHLIGSMFQAPKMQGSLKEFYGSTKNLSKKQQDRLRADTERLLRQPKIQAQVRPSGDLNSYQKQFYDELEEAGLLGRELTSETDIQKTAIIAGRARLASLEAEQKAAREQSEKAQIKPPSPVVPPSPINPPTVR
jgi:hypothetical protein